MAGLQIIVRSKIAIDSKRVAYSVSTFQQARRLKHICCAVSNFKISNVKKYPDSVNIYSNSVFRLASTNAVDIKTTEVTSGAKDSTQNVSENSVIPESQNSNIIVDESLLPPIPTPNAPSAPSGPTFVSEGDLKEPTFESLGLGGWWPPGIIQSALEYLHIQCDLPWWGAIAIVTTVLRLAMTPLTIKARKSSITMHNNLPELQLLQLKVNQARQSGDYYEGAHSMQQLHTFLKEKKISPFGFFLPVVTQTPIILSMFMGLRKMTSLPVESLHTGGLFWFTDLTVSDPYYILPITIAGTMYVMIKVGADGTSLNNMPQKWMRMTIKALPFVTLPFTINFPGAIQYYWVVSNMITLCQTLVLKVPVIRKWLNIPIAVRHNVEKLEKKKQSALEEFKESLTNMKIVRELEDRERLNTVTFEQAGTGPIPRTFKKNPIALQNSRKLTNT